MESVLGVTLSGDTAEPIRDDILLCRLMNKLHPGMCHEEVMYGSLVYSIHLVLAIEVCCRCDLSTDFPGIPGEADTQCC